MSIDFEIISEHVGYEHVQKLLRKIREEYEECDLHITVKLRGTYVSGSESLSEDKVSCTSATKPRD